MSTWRRRSRLNEFIRNSPWIEPAAAILVAIVIARGLRHTDEALRWKVFDFSADGARAVLGVFIASMLTFIVLVASTLLLVVQLASAALTPRIILPTFRNIRIRLALSTFFFAYALAIALIGRIEDDRVPQLALAFTIVANVLSAIFFVYFVMAIGMGLRPAFVLTRLAEIGRRVICEVYPREYDGTDVNGDSCAPALAIDSRATPVEYTGSSGALLAFDAQGLIDYAVQHDAVVELVPHVGDFVSHGEAVFKIHTSHTVDPQPLQDMISLGAERTFQQDATLSLRNIVDIANKALSPAINDPTTAVLAIDQLQRLLRTGGGRQLHSGRQTDAAGKVRLLFPTPKWEQFVGIACEEIRTYGATSPRILQRLEMMLVQLSETLREPRRPALREALRRIDATIASHAVDGPQEAPSRLLWD
jgi:uncharacterized membrane protein